MVTITVLMLLDSGALFLSSGYRQRLQLHARLMRCVLRSSVSENSGASVYMTLLDSELTKLVFHAIRSTVRDAIASAGSAFSFRTDACFGCIIEGVFEHVAAVNNSFGGMRSAFQIAPGQPIVRDPGDGTVISLGMSSMNISEPHLAAPIYECTVQGFMCTEPTGQIKPETAGWLRQDPWLGPPLPALNLVIKNFQYAAQISPCRPGSSNAEPVQLNKVPGMYQYAMVWINTPPTSWAAVGHGGVHVLIAHGRFDAIVVPADAIARASAHATQSASLSLTTVAMPILRLSNAAKSMYQALQTFQVYDVDFVACGHGSCVDLAGYRQSSQDVALVSATGGFILYSDFLGTFEKPAVSVSMLPDGLEDGINVIDLAKRCTLAPALCVGHRTVEHNVGLMVGAQSRSVVSVYDVRLHEGVLFRPWLHVAVHPIENATAQDCTGAATIDVRVFDVHIVAALVSNDLQTHISYVPVQVAGVSNVPNVESDWVFMPVQLRRFSLQASADPSNIEVQTCWYMLETLSQTPLRAPEILVHVGDREHFHCGAATNISVGPMHVAPAVVYPPLLRVRQHSSPVECAAANASLDLSSIAPRFVDQVYVELVRQLLTSTSVHLHGFTAAEPQAESSATKIGVLQTILLRISDNLAAGALIAGKLTNIGVCTNSVGRCNVQLLDISTASAIAVDVENATHLAATSGAILVKVQPLLSTVYSAVRTAFASELWRAHSMMHDDRDVTQPPDDFSACIQQATAAQLYCRLWFPQHSVSIHSSRLTASSDATVPVLWAVFTVPETPRTGDRLSTTLQDVEVHGGGSVPCWVVEGVQLTVLHVVAAGCASNFIHGAVSSGVSSEVSGVKINNLTVYDCGAQSSNTSQLNLQGAATGCLHIAAKLASFEADGLRLIDCAGNSTTHGACLSLRGSSLQSVVLQNSIVRPTSASLGSAVLIAATNISVQAVDVIGGHGHNGGAVRFKDRDSAETDSSWVHEATLLDLHSYWVLKDSFLSGGWTEVSGGCLGLEYPSASQAATGAEAVVELTNLIVANCSSGANGGGVWMSGASTILIQNTSVFDCLAGRLGVVRTGGGVFSDQQAAWRTIVRSSTAVYQGLGGGIALMQVFPSTQLHLRIMSVSGNQAIRGGGVYIGTQVPASSTTGSFALEECVLSDNSAIQEGGAVWAGITEVTPLSAMKFWLNRSSLQLNVAGQTGGAIVSDAIRWELVDTLLLINEVLSVELLMQAHMERSGMTFVWPSSSLGVEALLSIVLARMDGAALVGDFRRGWIGAGLSAPHHADRWAPKSVATSQQESGYVDTTLDGIWMTLQLTRCVTTINLPAATIAASSALRIAIPQGSSTDTASRTVAVAFQDFHVDLDRTSNDDVQHIAVLSVDGGASWLMHVHVTNWTASTAADLWARPTLVACEKCAELIMENVLTSADTSFISSSAANFASLRRAVQLGSRDVSHTSCDTTALKAAAVSALNQLGPLMLRHVWISRHADAARDVGAAINVVFGPESLRVSAAVDGPVMVLLDNSAIMGREVVSATLGEVTSGGGLRVYVRADVDISGRSRGQQVVIRRSLVLNNHAHNGHGGGLYVATPVNGLKSIKSIDLYILSSGIWDNSVSEQFGRGANIYTSPNVQFHAVAGSDIRVSSNRKVLQRCPTDISEFWLVLDEPGATCRCDRGLVATSALGTAGVYEAGLGCHFGWRRTVTPVEASTFDLNDASLLLDIVDRESVGCTPCEANTFDPLGTTTCVVCPEKGNCHGQGHVMPLAGYWMTWPMSGTTATLRTVRPASSINRWPLMLKCLFEGACLGFTAPRPCVADVVIYSGNNTMSMLCGLTSGVDVLELAACLSSHLGWVGVDNSTLHIDSTTPMRNVWLVMQSCTGGSTTVLLPIRVSGRTSALTSMPTPSSCVPYPLHLPVNSHINGTRTHAAFLEGGLTAGEQTERSGQFSGWLLPHGCSPGYTGPLCASCAAGYAVSGTECQHCSNPSEVLLLQAAVLIALTSLLVLWTFRTLRSGAQQGPKVALQRIAQTHLQALGTLTYVAPECEQVVRTVLSWVATVVSGSSAVNRLECGFQDDASPGNPDGVVSAPAAFYQAVVIYITPLIVMTVWCIAVLILTWWKGHRASEPAQRASSVRLVFASHILPGLIFILTFLYPGILRSMLTLLSCDNISELGQLVQSNPEVSGLRLPRTTVAELDDALTGSALEEPRLVVALAERCWQGRQLLWAVTWVIPFGVLYVGGLVLALYLVVRRLSHSTIPSSRTAPTKPEVSSWNPYAWLYVGYSQHRQYWGLVHIMLMILQVSGMVLLQSQSPGAVAGWAVVLLLVRLVLTTLWHPYATQKRSARRETVNARDMLSILEIGSCAALVGSAMAFAFMAEGATSEAAGRALSCSVRGRMGAGLVITCESAFLISFGIVFYGIQNPKHRQRIGC